MKTISYVLAGMLLFCFAMVSGGAFAQSAPAPYLTAYRYLDGGVLAGKISPAPSDTNNFPAIRNTYDGNGRLQKIETGVLASWQGDAIMPSAWTGFTVFTVETFAYDVDGRKIQDNMASADGVPVNVTQFSYDSFDRLTCTAVRMNPAAFGSLPADSCVLGTAGSDGSDRITENIYDSLNRVIQVRKAVGTSLEQAYVTNSYTGDSQKEYIIDANGNRSQQTYDGLDRLANLYFPSTTMASGFDPTSQATALATAGAVNTGDYENYGYDPNGNRTSLRKRDTRTITYSYDPLNRIQVKDIPDGTSPNVYYGYDLQGHQLFARFVSTSGEGVTNGYDPFGRLISSANNTGGATRTLNYEYDLDGDRTKIIHPDGTYFTTDYDGLDRPTVTHENGGAAIITLSYNLQGLRGGISRSSPATTAYGYDGIERLNNLAHDFSGTGSDQTWTLAYSAASQIKTLTSANDAFAWNGGVNASNGYIPNGLNQYASVAGSSFSYDANGNLTSDGSTSYSYDIENRLVSTTGAHIAGLIYDPNGRLFQTGPNSTSGPLWGSGITWGAGSSNSFNWTASSTAGTTQFLYDGDALVAEYDVSGNLLRRYVHGPDTDEPLVWYEGSGLSDRRFLHADHQGSIVAISDSSGNATTINSYDEYGVQGTSNTGRFQYTGQIWLPEVALYHYKARAYSPVFGRFMQTDPVGYQDQNNLYAYVGNDPTNKVDPTGKYTCVPSGDGKKENCTAAPGMDAVNMNVSLFLNNLNVIAHNIVSAITGSNNSSQGNGSSGSNDGAQSGSGQGTVPAIVGPGPNAHNPIPAGPSSTPTKGQQGTIDQEGAAHGCHTCGTNNPGTKLGHWVGDHQPPTRLNPEGKPQVYYPQCLSCSNQQGGRVSGIVRGSGAGSTVGQPAIEPASPEQEEQQ